MICIIQELGPGSSQRDKELELSRLRAHAASVSHKRRVKIPRFSPSGASSTRSRKFGAQTQLSGVPRESKRQNAHCGPIQDEFAAPSPLISSDRPEVDWVNSIPDENEADVINRPPSSSIPRDRLGFSCDPFVYAVRGRSYDTSMAVSFYTKLTMPYLAPLMKIFNVTNSYLFNMLCSPSPDAVLDAGVGSIRAIFEQVQQPGHDPSYVTLSYINRAILSVRKTIRQLMHQHKGAHDDSRAQLLDSTITAMIFLALCGNATKDSNAQRAHRLGLIALIEARGGIDNFNCCDGQARCALLKLDATWVLNGWTTMFPSCRPVYSPIYPSFPFSIDFFSKISKLPSGFQAMAHMRMLAQDLIEVLTRIADAQTYYDAYEMVADPSDLFISGHRRFNDYWEACTCFGAPDETVHVLSESGSTITVMSPNLQKLIVLSLILYCHHAFSPGGATMGFYHAYRASLTCGLSRKYAAIKKIRSSRLRGTEEEKWEDNVMLLWISSVVLDSWRGKSNTLLEPGVELLKEIKEHYSEIITWNQVEQRLKLFFYNQDFLTRCAGYWGLRQ